MSIVNFVSGLLLIFHLLQVTMLQPLNDKDTSFCDTHKYFTTEQKEFCYQNTELVKIFTKGYQLGHKQCQNAFQEAKSGTRWNCTNLVDKSFRNIFFGVPHAREGSKEHAVMTSFAAAGMLYHLIKKCQSNQLSSCRSKDLYPCQTSSKRCRQLDMQVPLRLIRTFFLASLGTYQTQLNQHNREIGFQVVKQLKYTSKYGYKEQLSSFEGVQNRLRSLYTGKSVRLKKRQLIRGKIPTLLLSLRSKLLFILRDDRFSYCHKNENWLWNGIGRRSCKLQTRDSFSLENCINLCCDFGYVNIPELKTICKGNPKTCRIKSINKYYCKYSYETVRKYSPFPWRDPPARMIERNNK